jgi:hypothetical protein
MSYSWTGINQSPILCLIECTEKPEIFSPLREPERCFEKFRRKNPAYLEGNYSVWSCCCPRVLVDGQLGLFAAGRGSPGSLHMNTPFLAIVKPAPRGEEEKVSHMQTCQENQGTYILVHFTHATHLPLYI